MDFNEFVESIRQEEADTKSLLSDGKGIRETRKSPEYLNRLAEAVELYSHALEGSQRAQMYFKEAMSTSDFPNLFGDILDRQLLAEYRAYPADWRQIAKFARVRDFRSVKRFPRPYGTAGILSGVAELASYPEVGVTEQSPTTYSVAKYGRKVPFSWETMINDDLDALQEIPSELAKAAVNSENKFVTELYVDSSGPHASLYTSGNSNIINTGNGAENTNPALSIAGLQDGMTVLGNQTDEDGNPIFIEAATLVVPPALEITAQNILNSTELRMTASSGGGTSEQELITQNWMRNRVRLVVNPWLPVVASSSNGSTSWYLFARPTSTSGAVEFGKLRGYEEPQILVKAPNQQMLGGGQTDVMDGDFDTDAITYKLRHIYGGVRLDGLLTVASDGSGS